MATQKKPESQMTQMEKAKLAAERVKEREKQKAETKKEPEMKRELKRSPNAAAVAPAKPMKRPSYMENMTPEQQIEEMKQMQKSEKAYEESRKIKPEGFKRGGMVSTTSRGQGKVMRTRKTRMC